MTTIYNSYLDLIRLWLTGILEFKAEYTDIYINLTSTSSGMSNKLFSIVDHTKLSIKTINVMNEEFLIKGGSSSVCNSVCLSPDGHILVATPTSVKIASIGSSKVRGSVSICYCVIWYSSTVTRCSHDRESLSYWRSMKVTTISQASNSFVLVWWIKYVFWTPSWNMIGFIILDMGTLFPLWLVYLYNFLYILQYCDRLWCNSPFFPNYTSLTSISVTSS